jgi:DNA-binding transcriptional ArsR family regulator
LLPFLGAVGGFNRRENFAKSFLRSSLKSMTTPDWFDPSQDAMLTPSALRGLVHPLRLRLLQLLQDDGPATATTLAARIDQSSGVASYHLRVLADHGFIAEDTDRGNARDRWWRAAHRSTSFTFRMPDDPANPATVEDAEQFLQLVADEAHRRVSSYIATIAARREELTEVPWHLGNWPLRLSVAQARELTEAIGQLLLPYRREQGDPAPAPDTVRAMFQFQLVPDELPPTPDQP